MSEYDPSPVIDRLLRQDEEGLKMYLVCRLGGAEELPRVYGELRTVLGRGDSADLARAPSLKSLAYATARRLALAVVPNRADDTFASLEWMSTPERESATYVELLDGIRLSLDPLTSEILELRYARALTVDEIGYVIGRRPSEVTTSIESGTRAVMKLARSIGSVDADVELLVRDSFRPRTVVDSAGLAPRRVQALRLAPGLVVGGRFEIQSSLQTGSMTATYVAGDTSMPGQSVILRVLHRPMTVVSARTGLVRKLRLVDSVDHPSIEHTLAHGWHQDRLWYATPWYRGHTLRELVDKRGLSPLEAIEIFGPISHGLAALHERGAIHRDVSLDNILLVQVGAKDSQETLPLLTGFDFWLADGSAPFDETREIAPETAKRLLEQGTAGTAAASEDIFLLGLTFLRSIEPSANAPPTTPWAGHLDSRAAGGVLLPRAKTVAPFAALLARALATDPSKRPPASQFGKELGQAKSRALITDRRRRWIGPIGIFITILAVFGLVFFMTASRLKIIRESNEAAERTSLKRELDAESVRSEQLEEELQRRRKTSE